jgi:hypothetical protein
VKLLTFGIASLLLAQAVPVDVPSDPTSFIELMHKLGVPAGFSAVLLWLIYRWVNRCAEFAKPHVEAVVRDHRDFVNSVKATNETNTATLREMKEAVATIAKDRK